MRPVVLQIGVTLDGYVHGAKGYEHWGLGREEEAVVAWKLDSLREAGTHIMSRRTYEAMAAVWPHDDSVYAAPMNDVPRCLLHHAGQRRLGGEPDRQRRPGRGHRPAQARTGWSDPRARRRDVHPLAGTGRPDRRVPAGDPPGRERPPPATGTCCCTVPTPPSAACALHQDAARRRRRGGQRPGAGQP